MGDSNTSFKPKINSTAQDPVLKSAEIAYMKLIEQKNRERVQKLQQIAKKNRITGLALGGGVLSVYLYSIFAVKQETFLDDFEEPVKVQQP
ncbi:cytochrome c oxidase assembly factor 3, mitochondrial [Helicoverpa armigera]|uniref:cytochrome c oxidase assembly factor 3, mitochondrial n=1 Tax=Helicoverpa armigera TaxID=29058 RepID=UPI000B391ABE|nr:cytochrome c oxidase assembly factor 3, mitochondrial [Helicoverpa armigera]XP_047027277.1 cytochrome c oxidase assembly factor 3, mitochondrial [Helicoverpa zea]